VRGQGCDLTYRDLDWQSDNLARTLLARTKAGKGEATPPAGICAGQNEQAIIGMLACLKAGRPFVFLSPDDPPKRRQLIARVAELDLVLAGRGGREAARQTAQSSESQIIDLTELAVEKSSSPRNALPLPSPQAGRDLAIVFTSGQSGQPSGVRRSQRSQLHQIRHLARRCAISPSDRIAMIIPPSFGACLNDVFLALLTGASLCPLSLLEDSSRLGDWLGIQGITYCHCVPSVFRAMARSTGTDLSALRWLKLGGEPLFETDLELLSAGFPPTVKVLSSYGSTETGGTITDQVLQSNTPCVEGRVLAGMPIPGKEVLIVDPQGIPQPPGTPGEIVVRSAYLASGYFKDPETDAERFTVDLHQPGLHRYKTRDLGVMDAEGNLRHLGRLDGQVKVRGIRINPAEIEVGFRSVQGILDCAVVPCPSSIRLHAFLVSSDRSELPDDEALRDLLSVRLPRGLFPHQLHHLPALPRLANGKTDREKLRALAAAARKAIPTTSSGEPRCELESTIRDIWRRVLDREHIGVYDNFYALGGDSLAAVSFQAELTSKLQMDLPAAALLGSQPTVAHVAEQIRHNYLLRKEHHGSLPALDSPIPALVQIRAGSSSSPQAPVFFLPGGYGSEAELVLFARMTPHFSPDRAIYGFRATTLYQLEPSPGNVQAVAAHYLREMRDLGVNNPPVLVGHCVAGLVAFEMAAQWERTHGPGPRPQLILVESASRRGWRTRNRQPAPSPAPVVSHPQFAEHYFTLLSNYVPGTYEGTARLLVSETFYEPEDPTLGWKDHILGGVDVDQISGNHHDLVRKNRDALGKALGRMLQSLEPLQATFREAAGSAWQKGPVASGLR
jgi:amino acid adenylation domain-containing protein